jgi:hypothetical protein
VPSSVLRTPSRKLSSGRENEPPIWVDGRVGDVVRLRSFEGYVPRGTARSLFGGGLLRKSRYRFDGGHHRGSGGPYRTVARCSDFGRATGEARCGACAGRAARPASAGRAWRFSGFGSGRAPGEPASAGCFRERPGRLRPSGTPGPGSLGSTEREAVRPDTGQRTGKTGRSTAEGGIGRRVAHRLRYAPRRQPHRRCFGTGGADSRWPSRVASERGTPRGRRLRPRLPRGFPTRGTRLLRTEYEARVRLWWSERPPTS